MTETTLPAVPGISPEFFTREAFESYITGEMKSLVLRHMDEMMGPAPPSPSQDSKDGAAE